MYGAFWHAVAKPGKKQELLEFLEWDAQVAGEKEPGTVSFDVYEDTENVDAIYVYESYRDAAAFAEHRANEPFQKFFPGGLRNELVGELKIIAAFSDSVVSKS